MDQMDEQDEYGVSIESTIFYNFASDVMIEWIPNCLSTIQVKP
jgi:hypothetical protein